jgi:hypothetical protein
VEPSFQQPPSKNSPKERNKSRRVQILYWGYGSKGGPYKMTYFILDSGASHDFVQLEDEGILKDAVIESHSTSFFVLAEGSHIVTQKHGKVEISFCCRCHYLLFFNVLCTLDIPMNLLSIGKSIAFELDFGFSGENCFVSVGDTVLGVVVRLDNKLYLLNIQVIISGLQPKIGPQILISPHL